MYRFWKLHSHVLVEKERSEMNTNLETGWGEQKGTKKMNEANEQHKGFQKKKKKKTNNKPTWD